jgi:aldose 1-epimerase
MTKQDFGKLPDGTPVELYTLTNKNGAEARIMTYGATVVSLKVPGRDGRAADVVLGYDSLDGYVKRGNYFGCIVGRYGNRIGEAHFSLDGNEYQLAKNDGPNTLHGGTRGFDKYVWQAQEAGSQSLALSMLSPDGDEGYPGALSVSVTYSLTDQNELRIDYSGTTDKPTVVNLTNHSYFNLAGQGEGDVLGHVVTILASRFTPVSATLIPTGELRPVAGTPFDFRKPEVIGARIGNDDQQLKYGNGYDHNWVLDRSGSGPSLAARAEDPGTGRVLEVYTTEPAMQLYTGNFLDGTITGKAGKVYGCRGAFCMETQHYPDAPNQPEFPSTTLRPGERYQTTTIYKFGVK